jgi:hypothetical protein
MIVHRRLGSLARDEEGMALVEFALVLVPFLIILMGAFDLGYQSFLRAQLTGALQEVTRRAAVETPDFSAEGDTIEERLKAELRERVDLVAVDGEYDISQTNFYEFSGVGRAEKLTTDQDGDGAYDEDEDCWQDLNDNGEFDEAAGREGRGGAGDVVFYEVSVEMPRLFPLHMLIDVDETMTVTARTAVRNQPYAQQAEPPLVCPES